jgi:Domain of unknown function (DUF4419)
MSTTTTTTFEVSNVKRATEPLPEASYKEAVEALLTSNKPLNYPGGIVWKRSQDLPKEPPSHPVEACTRYHGRLLADVSYHPVVAAVHRAFMEHRPLCLSPDMIWLMIIQGVANHINAHAEELRPRIVSHQGQVTIQVSFGDRVHPVKRPLLAEAPRPVQDIVGCHPGSGPFHRRHCSSSMSRRLARSPRC